MTTRSYANRCTSFSKTLTSKSPSSSRTRFKARTALFTLTSVEPALSIASHLARSLSTTLTMDLNWNQNKSRCFIQKDGVHTHSKQELNSQPDHISVRICTQQTVVHLISHGNPIRRKTLLLNNSGQSKHRNKRKLNPRSNKKWSRMRNRMKTLVCLMTWSVVEHLLIRKTSKWLISKIGSNSRRLARVSHPDESASDIFKIRTLIYSLTSIRALIYRNHSKLNLHGVFNVVQPTHI